MELLPTEALHVALYTWCTALLFMSAHEIKNLIVALTCWLTIFCNCISLSSGKLCSISNLTWKEIWAHNQQNRRGFICGNNTQTMCSGIYCWNPVKRAPRWYTRHNPIQQEDHLLNHVVFPRVLLYPISAKNKLPNERKKIGAIAKNAMRLNIKHTWWNSRWNQ